MHNFVRSECATYEFEIEYATWLKDVSSKLGSSVDENGIAHDLWLDGCDADDAALELGN
ncbi:hypothetical protein [Aeromonas media]|uniref:hypothetical protein n=1 Tax=Aeromonas media TaxID=651 RepID=UPI00148B0EB0|nr:hypothetical protein [Aeromonas media]